MDRHVQSKAWQAWQAGVAGRLVGRRADEVREGWDMNGKDHLESSC